MSDLLLCYDNSSQKAFYSYKLNNKKLKITGAKIRRASSWIVRLQQHSPAHL